MNVLTPIQGGGTNGTPDYLWWCPGCGCGHGIWVSPGQKLRWDWNGSLECPTFSPSVLVRGSDFTAKGRQDYEAWAAAGYPKREGQFESAPTVCHTFVRDGVMTSALASSGQRGLLGATPRRAGILATGPRRPRAVTRRTRLAHGCPACLTASQRPWSRRAWSSKRW